MSARKICLACSSASLVFWAAVAVATPAWAHPASGIVVDDRGQVYFMDTGHGLWQIDAAGKMTSRGGPPFHYLAIDRQGRFVEEHFARLAPGDVALMGTHPTLVLGSSYPVAIGSDGAFYYPEVKSKGRVRIMRMAAGELAQPFADLPVAREVGADGREIEAEWVWGLAAGPNGSLYYTEKKSVRRIALDGTVSLVAGDVAVPDCERPPAVKEARLEPSLYGLAVAEDATVYVAAAACSAVLKITPDGDVSVVLRATDRWSPQGVAIAGHDLYVLEYDYVEAQRREDWLPRVRKLAADGTVTVIGQVKSRPETGRSHLSPTDSSMLESVLPAPRMHAAVVHFPIVLAFVCVASGLLAVIFGRRYEWRVQALVSFGALAVACLVGEMTGNRAELDIPYGENGVPSTVWEDMHQHTGNATRLKTIAYAGTLLAIVALVPRKNAWLTWSQLVASGLVLCAAIGASVVAIRTAHWGGHLVYGHGVGTEPLITSSIEKAALNGRSPPETSNQQAISK
ncbi:MAG: DUF2231 domain-containing protein [Pirellulales bacterium]